MMESSKSKFFLMITVVVLAFLLVSGCVQKDHSTQEIKNEDLSIQDSTDQDPVVQKLVDELTGLAKIKDFEGISVSIYWFDPTLRFAYPRSLNDLFEGPSKSIYLEGDEIKGKLDLFSQITTKDVRRVWTMERVWARFYMVIESEKDGKLFEFLFHGDGRNFIVNGTQIRPNYKFLDIIMPFFDYDGRFDMRSYGSLH